jgi:hypothetical protein
VIFRSTIFTIGFALGAAAQAVAQLATPSAAPQPAPATAVPTPTAAVSQSPLPSPTPAATVAPTVSPSGAPSATSSVTPSAAPAASPTATATATPTASPGMQFKYVVDPTPDPSAAPGGPQILKIEINDRTVHVGGLFACRITTTPNVATLVLSVDGHQIGIPKAQDGVFAGQQNIPGFIPPWFLKTYQVTFNALTADGQKSSTTVPVTLSY